ncbi:unnamed protein product, partial [Meganyctiphanes norvegica]|uniref:Peroxisomal membrane protein 11C n=1 Tax=Meganyctiphanes norvegica TaxID=48144 RepID=A0AAV2PYV8_MEGNR
MKLAEVIRIMESFRGREKTMRTLQYAALLITRVTNESCSDKLKIISSQLGTGRLITRLFDDLSMAGYSLHYGTGPKQEDLLARILQVFENGLYMLYFPVEHIAWARQNEVLPGSEMPFWGVCLLIWGLSLGVSITKSLRQIYVLETKTKGSSHEEHNKKWMSHVLNIVMQSADLLNCLNWLGKSPFGIQMKPWHTGLLGLISSLIGFQKILTMNK